MPKLNPLTFKGLRKEADWSTEELAAMLGMADGSLRNAECAREPMGDRKIHRAARLFSAAVHRPVTYQQLVGEDTGDGVPETPPDQPKAPKKPERRKEKGGSGPKRDQNVAGAA